jgi:hypothetical protein
LIVCGQISLYDDWARRLLYFPAQFMVGVAVVLSNSLAVMTAFQPSQKPPEFKRTPKFRVTSPSFAWANSHYRLTVDRITYAEGALACYATFGLVSALMVTPTLAPYMLTYACSFGFFALWNLYQTMRK